uniref:Uncharacterized protein n=2 Tax=Denticeps clupeoides TaxID=299321 RepID=A0AAY4AXN6_9TELE
MTSARTNRLHKIDNSAHFPLITFSFTEQDLAELNTLHRLYCFRKGDFSFLRENVVIYGTSPRYSRAGVPLSGRCRVVALDSDASPRRPSTTGAKMAARPAALLLASCLISACVLGDGTPLRRLWKGEVWMNVVVTDLQQNTEKLQIGLNVSAAENLTYVNDVKQTSGVTRLPCRASLLDRGNSSDGAVLDCVMRLMVDQLHLKSDAGEEVLVLLLTQEVIEVAGSAVQQEDVCEVKLLLSENLETALQFTSFYPMSRSKLSTASREDDVVMTDASAQETVEDQVVLHTTSHYFFRHGETTQEETGAPGKLPETPLWTDTVLPWTTEEKAPADDLLPDTPLRGSISSYNAMCQWVEQLRDRLRHFGAESLPLFFLVMWVVVVGVVGSAVIIRILDLVFPSSQSPGVFHLNPATLLPDDERCGLLENVETDPQDEKKP